jgi:glycerophosphoryl diester phosphodiesterase
VHIPPIIGHRGAADTAPENTLASLRQAFAEGARMVEIDVRLSSDGIPILLHDDTLDRTTGAHGPADQWTAEALGALDAGFWKADRFFGEPIPALSEVILLCTDLGLMLNIEIKPNPGQDEQTAWAIADLLTAQWPDSLPWPLVSSFSVASLVALRRVAPHLPRGLLFGHRPAHWREIVEQTGARTLHLWDRAESPESVAILAHTGLPILIYTVNDVVAARRWLDSGARAVITDCPGQLLRDLETDRPMHQTAR